MYIFWLNNTYCIYIYIRQCNIVATHLAASWDPSPLLRSLHFADQGTLQLEIVAGHAGASTSALSEDWPWNEGKTVGFCVQFQ